MAFPTVYPTGTTLYKGGKAWNGYTIFTNIQGAILIDMNGNVVKQWKGIGGASHPNYILPGGYLMGTTGYRSGPGHQDNMDVVQVDWDGKIVWQFNRYDEVKDPGKAATWMARMHHDYQREGSPVGYYTPGMSPLVDQGNTMILSHKNLQNPTITDKLLVDDVMVEVTWDGKIVWEWRFSEHVDELGFSEEAKQTLYREPGWNALRGSADWLHVNSMSTLGPNKWYNGGDQRFHPDNLIWSGREANIIGITDKQSGKIVWQVGPDYTAPPALQALGQIIGQHHPHMIPQGLPGAGNILVFDDGGTAGYGAQGKAWRDYSRVIEFDAVTLKLVWEYSPATVGYQTPQHGYRFYSGFFGSAQRLPNGNTFITESVDGRLFEVTPDREIVWEYMSPFFETPVASPRVSPRELQGVKPTPQIYRAYRVPYEWVPQLQKPVEQAVTPPDNAQFRVSP